MADPTQTMNQNAQPTKASPQPGQPGAPVTTQRTDVPRQAGASGQPQQHRSERSTLIQRPAVLNPGDVSDQAINQAEIDRVRRQEEAHEQAFDTVSEQTRAEMEAGKAALNRHKRRDLTVDQAQKDADAAAKEQAAKAESTSAERKA